MKRSPARAVDLMLAGLLSWAVALPGTVLGAGTPGAGGDDLIGGDGTPEQAARKHYAEGLAAKEQAAALEREAATAADAAQRDELLTRARSSWERAAAAQGKALKLDLDDHQAANELGYALRKSGQHRKALGAYNFALEIKPDFFPAIEYRGEAYLALGMLDDARAAYMILFRNEPSLAARLLAAMESSGVQDPAFRAWVAERAELAEITPGLNAADGERLSDW